MKPLFLASLLAASALAHSEVYSADQAPRPPQAPPCCDAPMTPPVLDASRLQWRPYSDGDLRYVMLWDVGTDAMVGAYTFASGCYQPCGPDGHLMDGVCTRPPIPPPVQPKAAPITYPEATYYYTPQMFPQVPWGNIPIQECSPGPS